MKLLFAIKTMEVPGGGAERVLANVTGALADRGHRVALLSFDAPGGRSFYPVQANVERMSLGIGNVGRGTGPGEAIRRMAAMRRIATGFQPDVAVGFMHSAFIPLGLALAGTAIPVLASEHTAGDHYRDRPLQRALLRLSPLLVRRITVVSESVRASFPAALQRRMTVLPNPVGIKVEGRADPIGARSEIKTLLSVGGLTEMKNHAVLIDAFGQLATRFPDWRLRIVGDGPLRTTLEEQARMLGLSERVVLTGAVSDVAREYRAAQAFVIPSRYESFGLATAEALSFGLPAVGFADCPGTNELIEHERNGLLVAGEDKVGALTDALARLMASAEMRAKLGAGGLSGAERFLLEAVAAAWEKLLTSLCEGGHLPASLASRTE